MQVDPADGNADRAKIAAGSGVTQVTFREADGRASFQASGR
jgi:hypothetical protein